jgi:hypothetical protein
MASMPVPQSAHLGAPLLSPCPPFQLDTNCAPSALIRTDPAHSPDRHSPGHPIRLDLLQDELLLD